MEELNEWRRKKKRWKDYKPGQISVNPTILETWSSRNRTHLVRRNYDPSRRVFILRVKRRKDTGAKKTSPSLTVYFLCSSYKLLFFSTVTERKGGRLFPAVCFVVAKDL